jgi:hypothetical protein
VVGPSLSDPERDTANRRLKVGFVALVAVSGGLVAVRAGAPLAGILAAAAAAGLLGLVLLWFTARWSREFRQQR